MTTSAPNELYPVLKAFKSALVSIDLRCIAVSPPSEEGWQNLVTSIFLSDRTVDEVKDEQETIPEIRNSFFAIFHDALPFSYSVLERIAEGQLSILAVPFGRNKIKFRKSDLFMLEVSSSEELIDGSYAWMLKTADSGSEEERKELWSIVDEQSILAKQSGFKSIPQMIEHYLRIKYSNRQRKDIEIAIYPPATIENLRFKNNLLEVILKKTSKLNDLRLNLRLDRDNRNIWRHIREIAFEKTEFKSNPEVIEIQKSKPFDSLHIELIHRNSGLTLDSVYKTVPIKNVAEPFLKAFDAFCSLEKLKKMLFESENYGKNPDQIFENAVTWLLSLAGFETVHLGVKITKLNGKKETFDELHAESGYHIGSADIIAYEGNERILLIDCDIGTVDPKKVQQLAELKKHFREKLKDYEKMPIVPILFSPRDFRKSSPSIDVMIADKRIIKMIFEAVVQGNREKARSILHYSGF